MFYAAPRYTKDLDIWVRPTRENAERVHRALAAFGAPLDGQVPIHVLAIEDLMTNKRAVGRPQDLIDLEHLERARKR